MSYITCPICTELVPLKVINIHLDLACDKKKLQSVKTTSSILSNGQKQTVNSLVNNNEENKKQMKPLHTYVQTSISSFFKYQSTCNNRKRKFQEDDHQTVYNRIKKLEDYLSKRKISLDNMEFFEEIDQTKYINILQIKDWNDVQYFYFDIKVFGHTFALQHEIEEDCKNDSMNDKKKSKIKLIREPNNSKDKNACKLRLCNQEYCRDIGYLSKGVVEHLSPLIDQHIILSTQVFLIPGIYETKETQLTLGSINQVRICAQITTDFVNMMQQRCCDWAFNHLLTLQAMIRTNTITSLSNTGMLKKKKIVQNE
ncbi:hypothetical protein RFI_01469 [Reticulomyxa filosa]|uniref:HIRAN domain-containing protein n=1 Tax=Reticulomyxa filosa TaxID=46433 RepID=X6PC06_RETFI|nr:hypothetical protein RFI_01469 [Reticulomyxa filosa]|eukprot:ETO35594.1 hypothetical protein RFI_01469 [Reticulomyxa filosa]